MTVAPSFYGTSSYIDKVGPIPSTNPELIPANYPGRQRVLPFTSDTFGVITQLGYAEGDPAPGYTWWTYTISTGNPTLTGQYGSTVISHPTGLDAESSLVIDNVIPLDSSRVFITGSINNFHSPTPLPTQYFVQVLQLGADNTITLGTPVFISTFTNTTGGWRDANMTNGTTGYFLQSSTVVAAGYPNFAAPVASLVASDTVVVGVSLIHHYADGPGTVNGEAMARKFNISGLTVTPASSGWSTVMTVTGTETSLPVFQLLDAEKLTNNKATFLTLVGPNCELRAFTADSTTMTSSTHNVITALSACADGSERYYGMVNVSDGRLGIYVSDSSPSFSKAWFYAETGAINSTVISDVWTGPGWASRNLTTPNSGLFVSYFDGALGVVGEIRWDDTGVASLVGPTTLNSMLFDGEAYAEVVGNFAILVSPYDNGFGNSSTSPGSRVTIIQLEGAGTVLPSGFITPIQSTSSGIASFVKLLGDFTLVHVNGNEDITNADVALVFNDYDEDGTLWLVSQVTGWWTTPDPDSIDTERGWSDGSYYDTGRYKARVFTIAGTFIPKESNGHYVQRARDRLIRAVATIRRTGVAFIAKEADTTAPPPFSSTDDYTNIAKYSFVLPSGAPLIDTVSMTGRNDWAITFRAPDPTKYSVTPAPVAAFESHPTFYSDFDATYALYSNAIATGLTYSGTEGNVNQVDVNNIGNYRTPCTIQLTGPVTAPPLTISNAATGQSIVITHTVGAGQVLKIDTNTRRVTLDGAYDYRYYLAPDVDWIYIDPGVNTIQADTGTNPDALLELQFRHGWIG